MLISIQDGHWYETETDYHGYPAIYKARFNSAVNAYELGPVLEVKADGTGNCTGKQRVTREVTVTPVLGFPLEAGKRYCTTKPDGTPGPVVTLKGSGFSSHSLKAWVPLQFTIGSFVWYVNWTGDAMHCSTGETLRITAPYIEPKPPTITEQLEQLRSGPGGYKDWSERFDLAIEAVKALEGTK